MNWHGNFFAKGFSGRSRHQAETLSDDHQQPRSSQINDVIISNVASVNLDLKFELASTVGADGLLSNIGLKIELLDINGPLIDAAENLPPDDDGNPVFSKADTLATMKRQVDRTVDFSVAGGGKIAAMHVEEIFRR